MRDKMKKTLGIMLATVCLGAMFAGCGEGTLSYKGDKLDGYVSSATVSSNGGFAVEKGAYTYFINGQAAETDNNKYGETVKGALMRIPTADLKRNDFSKVKTVVPSLFVAKDYDAGIFIYGDYVYYATPTTDKTDVGETATSYIDFKKAKLDGSEGAMKDYFLRLSENTSRYRFVKENGVVYCIYEENVNGKAVLKSVNTETKENGKDDQRQDGSAAQQLMEVGLGEEADNQLTQAHGIIYCALNSLVAFGNQRDQPANDVHNDGSNGGGGAEGNQSGTHQLACPLCAFHVGNRGGDGAEHHGNHDAEHHVDEQGAQGLQHSRAGVDHFTAGIFDRRPESAGHAAGNDTNQHENDKGVVFQELLHRMTSKKVFRLFLCYYTGHLLQFICNICYTYCKSCSWRGFYDRLSEKRLSAGRLPAVPSALRHRHPAGLSLP